MALGVPDVCGPQDLGGCADAARAERGWGLWPAAIVCGFRKYIVKEIVVPAGADQAVFFLAPMVSLVMALIAWAVIPFNDGWVLSDINVAILYVFAVSSLEVYGVIMGGWASNSKYPFLGSLRSAAQMISYEVSIGLIIIGVIISTGSMNFGDIVRRKTATTACLAGTGCRTSRC